MAVVDAHTPKLCVCGTGNSLIVREWFKVHFQSHLDLERISNLLYDAQVNAKLRRQVRLAEQKRAREMLFC